MRFIGRLLRRVGAFCIGALSFLSSSEATTRSNGIAEELPYRIDTEIVAVETAPDCDQGDFDGKPSLNVPFILRIPQESSDQGIHVRINVLRKTVLTFNRPFSKNTRFTIDDIVTIKYPLISQRQYAVEAEGVFDEKNVEALVKLRRIGKAGQGKRFCQLTFRLKNSERKRG